MPLTQESGLPKISHTTKDSISFRQFDIEGGHIVLTEEGNTLLHNKDVLDRLRKYINELTTPNESLEPSSRIYFREGGNAHIYILSDLPLAIKEMSNSKSMVATLTKLEVLRKASKYFPQYIKVPAHYGVLSSSRLSKEYLLMQKINDGLNVWDIIEQPNRFGEAGTLAIEQFNKAKTDIRNILISQGLDPEVYMADWKEENVLVDFSLPSPSLPFTLWVIDQ